MAATIAAGMGLLALSGWFITATALAGITLATVGTLSLDIYAPGGGIRAFALGRTIFRYVERLYNHDTVLRMIADIRVGLFQKLAAGSIEERRRQSGANWLVRLIQDVESLDTLYLRILAPTVIAVIGLLALVAATWLLIGGGVAALILLMLLSSFVLATVGTFVRTRGLSAQMAESSESLRVAITGVLDGQSEWQAAGLTHQMRARTQDDAQRLINVQAEIERCTGLHQALSAACNSLAVLLLLVAGCEMVAREQIASPLMVVLPLALFGLNELLAMLPDAYARLGGTVVSATRLNRDSLARRRFGARDSKAVPNNPHRSLVWSVHGKDFDERRVGDRLARWSLDIHDGESVAIIGESGSGKSTIADRLAGIDDAQANLPDHSHSPAPAKIGYLSQATVLFEDTVRFNLTLGRDDITDADIWPLLTALNLDERLSEPGLDAWIGHEGIQLSGGEQRRLVLARVLLTDRPHLLLDEPFTGVDETTRAAVLKQIQPWIAGKTTVSFAHSAEVLPAFDRLIQL